MSLLHMHCNKYMIRDYFAMNGSALEMNQDCVVKETVVC